MGISVLGVDEESVVSLRLVDRKDVRVLFSLDIKRKLMFKCC